MASIPYGDDREASTSEEEAATYNAEMKQEAEVDQFFSKNDGGGKRRYMVRYQFC